MVGHPSSLSSPRDCRLTTDSHRPPHPSEKKRTSSMPLGKLTPLFLLIMMLPSFSYCFTCPSPRGAWAPSASLLTLPPSLHCCAVAVVAIDNFLGPIKRSGLTKVMVFGQTSHIHKNYSQCSYKIRWLPHHLQFGGSKLRSKYGDTHMSLF